MLLSVRLSSRMWQISGQVWAHSLKDHLLPGPGHTQDTHYGLGKGQVGLAMSRVTSSLLLSLPADMDPISVVSAGLVRKP